MGNAPRTIENYDSPSIADWIVDSPSMQVSLPRYPHRLLFGLRAASRTTRQRERQRQDIVEVRQEGKGQDRAKYKCSHHTCGQDLVGTWTPAAV